MNAHEVPHFALTLLLRLAQDYTLFWNQESQLVHCNFI